MTVTIDGSASVTINSGAVLGLNSATAVASTSGTSIDFTSIPSYVKRITVLFNGVSTSGTSLPQIQIGAGSITTTGYVSWASVNTGINTVGINSSTTGFHINSNVAANVLTIQMVITLVSGNDWIETHSGIVNSGQTHWGGAKLTLAGTLDRVRITTVNGTDTFDAGTINILYE